MPGNTASASRRGPPRPPRGNLLGGWVALTRRGTPLSKPDVPRRQAALLGQQSSLAGTARHVWPLWLAAGPSPLLGVFLCFSPPLRAGDRTQSTRQVLCHQPRPPQQPLLSQGPDEAENPPSVCAKWSRTELTAGDAGGIGRCASRGQGPRLPPARGHPACSRRFMEDTETCRRGGVQPRMGCSPGRGAAQVETPVYPKPQLLHHHKKRKRRRSSSQVSQGRTGHVWKANWPTSQDRWPRCPVRVRQTQVPPGPLPSRLGHLRQVLGLLGAACRVWEENHPPPRAWPELLAGSGVPAAGHDALPPRRAGLNKAATCPDR